MNVRIGIITLFLVGIGMSGLQAQRARYKPQAHQIEIRMAGLDALAGYSEFESFAGMPVAATVVNGLRYTYSYSLTDAFRAGVTYSPTSWTATEPVSNLLSYSNRIQTFDAQLGYIRRYHTGPFQLYGGVDLRAGQSMIDENGSTVNSIYARDYRSNHYGGSGILGVRTFLSPYLSFAIEANATYLRHSPIQQDQLPEPSYLFFAEETFSGGIAAYLSFHFVPMKKRCSCPKVRR